MTNAMQIYKNHSGSYRLLKEMPFEHEKALWTLVEKTGGGGIFDRLELSAVKFPKKLHTNYFVQCKDGMHVEQNKKLIGWHGGLGHAR